VNVRHEMLGEALTIIRDLLGGGYVNFAGDHFRVDSAKIWDLHDQPVPMAVAVSGAQSIERVASNADHMISTEPRSDLVTTWDQVTGNTTSRKIGQIPVCWDQDRDRAVERAHREFRWFAGGWKVNAELPGTAGFAGATTFVRPEDVAESIPCGPDVDAIVSAVKQFTDAGFTDVALVQIGDEGQDEFLQVAQKEILPALRSR
jgi:G6PDH family F420-dependent oxidoreductase